MFSPVKSKYPAEIISVLLRRWCHTYGLSEYILSDRGKEFLGVTLTVCEVLGVKQVKTTPYHPRTNGLHKMLTYELKIRTNRKPAPEWSELLTRFRSVTTLPLEHRQTTCLLSVRLVFGREPRMSS